MKGCIGTATIVDIDDAPTGGYYVRDVDTDSGVRVHNSKYGPLLVQVRKHEYAAIAHSDSKTILTFSIIRDHQTCPRSTWNFLMQLGLSRSRHTGAAFQGLNSSGIARLETGRLQLYMNRDRDENSALSRSSGNDSTRVVMNYPEFGQGGARKRTGQLPGVLPLALGENASDLLSANDECESDFQGQRLAFWGITNASIREQRLTGRQVQSRIKTHGNDDHSLLRAYFQNWREH